MICFNKSGLGVEMASHHTSLIPSLDQMCHKLFESNTSLFDTHFVQLQFSRNLF